MASKESEYRTLFYNESLENHEKLNQLFVELEKNLTHKPTINGIFRIVHTLKGNSMLMGADAISDLSHIMEDVFDAIRNGEIEIDEELMPSLFRANDKLGALIESFQTGKRVSYLGIKTKLSVLLKNVRETEVKNEVDSDVESDANGNSEEEDSVGISFADVVQIPVKKMDELLNQIGELVIERDRLIAVHSEKGQSTVEFDALKRITSGLHYSIMNVRMVQMSFLFNKFHRVLRDVATSEKKQVKLELQGTDVEIDRNILKVIGDSMIHMVRNAVSHGIETADERKKTDKDTFGTVTLGARHEKDHVILTVQDDGKGIDPAIIRRKIVEKKLATEAVAERLSDAEVIRYIFEAGFSSADQITEFSGRGVGMDVVKKAVESIGGQVLIDSKVGEGTTIDLILPSSLALKSALIIELKGVEYCIPMTNIEAVLSLKETDLHHVGNGLMIQFEEETIPVAYLKELFEDRMGDDDQETSEINVVVVSHSGRKLALNVDRLNRQMEIIEKKLPRPLNESRLLSGGTILGSGRVCPVLDIASIMDSLFKKGTEIN